MKILWDKSEKPPTDGRWGKWQTIRLTVQYEFDKSGKESNMYVTEDRYYQLKIKDEIMTMYNVPERMLEELLDRAYAEGSLDEAEANAGEDI